MKKTLLKLSLFSCTLLLVFADQIENNQKRIQQIDSQVKKNNQTINSNKNEISKAKNTENATIAQIKKLDGDIVRLENEYKLAEQRYREILKKIGINDANINAKISEININTQIINDNKEDLYNKIRTWDKIRRLREMSNKTGVSSSSEQNKMTHDLKILFNKQREYIQGVENIRKGVEGEKSQEEAIKAKNQNEANEVNAAKTNLENKSRELNAAKKEKNVLVAQLRGKQATLASANKNIEKDNTKLVNEKRKLNAQIQAIIQRAIRERELAMQRAAAEERRRKEEIERVRREAEAQKRVAEERRNRELAGQKEVSSNDSTNNETVENTQTKATSNTSSRGQSTSLAGDKKTTSNTQKTINISSIGKSSSSSTSSSSYSSSSSVPKTTVQIPKGTGSLIMPINGSVVVGYGQEKTEGLRSNGIEIRGSLGQGVKAADGGIVIYAGGLNTLGSVVIIDHGSLVTVYGNLSGVSVSKGATVTKGQIIGTLGRDQLSKEPTLYFETRRGVNIVNPMSYL